MRGEAPTSPEPEGGGRTDTLDRYARAGEAGDVDAVVALYAPDGVLRSPIVGRFAFRGEDDLRTLMTAVYATMREARFTARALEGSSGMLAGTSRVLGLRVEEAFVFELDEQQRIQAVTVHIRPLAGLVALALALGARLLRHPGVLWRAAR